MKAMSDLLSRGFLGASVFQEWKGKSSIDKGGDRQADDHQQADNKGIFENIPPQRFPKGSATSSPAAGEADTIRN